MKDERRWKAEASPKEKRNSNTQHEEGRINCQAKPEGYKGTSTRLAHHAALCQGSRENFEGSSCQWPQPDACPGPACSCTAAAASSEMVPCTQGEHCERRLYGQVMCVVRYRTVVADRQDDEDDKALELWPGR